MAESESIDCPCSNITIMQLFHELKQKYPTVPDQIVSKIIQENFHDKSACETILRRESHNYLQSYPGALISGNPKDSLERGPLCNHCPGSRSSISSSSSSTTTTTTNSQQQTSESGDVTLPPSQCTMPNNRTQVLETSPNEESAFSNISDNGICLDKSSDNQRDENNQKQTVSNYKNKCASVHSPSPRQDVSTKIKRPVSLDDKMILPVGQLVEIAKQQRSEKEKAVINVNDKQTGEEKETGDPPRPENDSETSVETLTGNTSEEELKDTDDVKSSKSSAVINERTCERLTDKKENLPRSQSCVVPISQKDVGVRERENRRWSVEDGGSAVVSGVISRPGSSGSVPYQVAVQYTLQPVLPIPNTRTSDPPRPFTSVNLCLRPPSSEPQPPIEIQSGQSITYSTTSFDPNKGFQSQLQIRIGPELLSKQRERRDLLARELRREKEKLRRMKDEVRQMQDAIALKPSPDILPKLKAEIGRLRAECNRLTAAVDHYQDSQNNLPLGETDEEFYRNIYTGQRLQSEGHWSCHVCTFRNHPLLSVCEECEMPRLSLGTSTSDVASRFPNVFSNNNTSFCTGAGTSTSASLITAPLQER